MRAFILVFLLMVSFSSFGHNYYFAFAEVEYNDISQKFEITIVATTHDLEIALNKNNIIQMKLDDQNLYGEHRDDLEKYLNQHLSIKADGTPCDLKLLGQNISNVGTMEIYLESSVIPLTESIEFFFDLLMDEFEEQQNKITLYYRNKQYTFPFLLNETVQTLNLENN